MNGERQIRLLLADVDGTLITSAKVLAPSTIEAARRLQEDGIRLAITSSRPPRGLLQFIEALGIDSPTGAFNGGAFVRPDLAVIEESPLPEDLASAAIGVLRNRGVDPWVYTGTDWYVQDLDWPHVARETKTLQFSPTVVDSYDGVIDEAVKIVGVTDDPEVMANAEQAVHTLCGTLVSASLSQTYYLDITHPNANKGNVVARLSEFLDVPFANIATIGDGANDILMFRRSGLSIAMGNAKPEVKAEAEFETASNDEDGFAQAVDRYILSTR
jgi:Cof subfamily protein (haloacid dehalogenase superfamily)